MTVQNLGQAVQYSVHRLPLRYLCVLSQWLNRWTHRLTTETQRRRESTEYHRPYVRVRSRRRVPISSVNTSSSNRQVQFPDVLLGRFIRASFPKPSRSCKGTIATSATDANAARMKSQFISRPSEFKYLRQNSRSRSISSAPRVDPLPSPLVNQPTVASLSRVPV